MGKTYESDVNPFQDVLVRALEGSLDISEPNVKANIHAVFEYILENVLEDKNYLIYLDFDIQNKNGYYNIIGKNVLSAMWLSGFFAYDIESILKSNTFIIGNKKFKYNKKKYELTYIEMHE